MMSSNLSILLLCLLTRPSTGGDINTHSEIVENSTLRLRGGNNNEEHGVSSSSKTTSSRFEEMLIEFTNERQRMRKAAVNDGKGGCKDIVQLKYKGIALDDFESDPIQILSSDGATVTFEFQHTFGSSAGDIDVYISSQEGVGKEVCHPFKDPSLSPLDVVGPITATCMTLEPYALVDIYLDGPNLEQVVDADSFHSTVCCIERGGYAVAPKKVYTFAVPCIPGCPQGGVQTPSPTPQISIQVTPAPVTPAPVTPAPVTAAPVTAAPVTAAPVTAAPVTPAPVTPAPVTPAPVTPAPVTPAPVTPAPVTPAPTVDSDTKGGTDSPVDNTCICDKTRVIPTRCEVQILINIMDEIVDVESNLPAQWLRAAFHDAGTRNIAAVGGPVGGAKGCLMNDDATMSKGENGGLLGPIDTLEAIRDAWEGHEETCIDISAADIIQFAGWFAAIRQRGVPGFSDLSIPGTTGANKFDKLLDDFEWGRPDEANCNADETESLPGFRGGEGGSIPHRCKMVSKEIHHKMMERNGFSAEEACALIGGHTIGLVRNTFGSSLAGPWVPNGADKATANGPVFDNAYFSYLIDHVGNNGYQTFVDNNWAEGTFVSIPGPPYEVKFGDWFQDTDFDPDVNLAYLDTDVVLAFDPVDFEDPLEDPLEDYQQHSSAFALSNVAFLTSFDNAYDKMSKLGVDNALTAADPCHATCSTTGEIVDIVTEIVSQLDSINAIADEVLDNQMADNAACIDGDTINLAVDPDCRFMAS